MKIFEEQGKKTSIIKKYYQQHFDEHLMIKITPIIYFLIKADKKL